MAKKTKKTTKKVTKKAAVAPKNDLKISANKFAHDISSQLKLGESYISLVLGAVVVLGISMVFFLFIKESGVQTIDSDSPVVNEKSIPEEIVSPANQTYTLGEGEGLWDVAVKFYGDGYRWVDIAKANNLTEEQANNVAPGTKVIIPKL